jgi:hypothetical protein
MPEPREAAHAWNPGLSSEIPGRLLPRVTLYDPKNSWTDHAAASEVATLCGLKPHDMVAFKVSRLVVHEVLIRVTADLEVPDGPSYEELGFNLRGMVATILDKHVAPRLPQIEERLEELRAEIDERLTRILDRDVFPSRPTTQPKRGFLSRFLGGREPAGVDRRPSDLHVLQVWQRRIDDGAEGLEEACLRGLLTVVGGIVGQRGRLVADRSLIVRLASTWICNHHGSDVVGDLVSPIIVEAARVEGYRLLPHQASPEVMNVKGASAGGKSTIRPLQRELAERLGIPWSDFALVSPDYWRKFLLDYGSLGEDYKYAAMLTGQELEIIDKKLDRYMEGKAARAEMPHLLIDRFRFDSFASAPSQQADSRLLSRFGHRVFMFFMITPPADTVERAWKRGITTGRYKALDDLLFHNIEAYTGMPQLYFNWANKERQKVHFEFLDNSVAHGERPRTAAFGWNRLLFVLDIDCMRSLDRYRRVNVDARRPEDVLLPSPGTDDDILADCIRKIPDVVFLNPDTLTVLGRTRDGVLAEEVGGFFERAGLAHVLRPDAASDAGDPPAFDPDHERLFTVGSW